MLGLAKQARLNRRFDLLETISEHAIALLPDTQFARVAEYYSAHCLYRREPSPEAQARLEIATELAPAQYKGSALLALAGIHLTSESLPEFRSISLEAIKASRGLDSLSEIQAVRNVAISLALQGDHCGALSLLQSLSAITRATAVRYPTEWPNHLNSLALEMGALGRVEEAKRVIDYVLSTPFGQARPECYDTKQELATKPRLAFPRFTIALGAPARSEPETYLSQDRDPAPVRSTVRLATSSFGTPAVPSAAFPARAGTGPRKRTAAQTRRLTGYAISPPARAPPTPSHRFKHPDFK